MSIGIDSKVRITGPSVYMGACAERIGDTFIVDQMWKRKGEICYSGEKFNCWYHDTSLELAEDELKIGDEVIIEGQPKGVSGKPIGLKLPIEAAYKDCSGAMGYKVNGWWYLASSLRKVSKQQDTETFEEAWKRAIETRLGKAETRIEDLGQWHDQQVEANSKLRKRCHEAEQKISQLEERDGIQQKQLSKQSDAISGLMFDRAKHNDRIRDLEAWQKDHGYPMPHEDLVFVCKDGFVPTIGNVVKVTIKGNQEVKVGSPIVLDEPIKVGDWVQVKRSWKRGEFPHDSAMNAEGRMDRTVGMVGKIQCQTIGESWRVEFSDGESWSYPSAVLHVLSDAEIASRLNEGRT
jgi:hypothetical protein